MARHVHVPADRVADHVEALIARTDRSEQGERFVSPTEAAAQTGLDRRQILALVRTNAIDWFTTDRRELRVSVGSIATLLLRTGEVTR